MAESFETQLGVAKVYADALFELAKDADHVDDVRRELDELMRLSDGEPSLAAFFASNAVNLAERRASLERMFRGKLSDIVVDALQVMNTHGRSGLVLALRRAFEVRQEQAAGQIEVRVTSAVELSDEQRRQCLALSADLSGRIPLAVFEVDRSLIGGLMLQVGEFRFDNSIRRRLGAARLRLHERGERGLEVGRD